MISSHKYCHIELQLWRSVAIPILIRHAYQVMLYLLPTTWFFAQIPSLPQIWCGCRAEGENGNRHLVEKKQSSVGTDRNWRGGSCPLPHCGAVCVHVAELRDSVLGVDGDDDLRARLVPVRPTRNHFLTLRGEFIWRHFKATFGYSQFSLLSDGLARIDHHSLSNPPRPFSSIHVFPWRSPLGRGRC